METNKQLQAQLIQQQETVAKLAERLEAMEGTGKRKNAA